MVTVLIRTKKSNKKEFEKEKPILKKHTGQVLLKPEELQLKSKRPMRGGLRMKALLVTRLQ